MPTIIKAILSLEPKAQFVVVNNVITEWLSTDIPQPTDAEIEGEVERLIAEQPAKEIRQQRDRLLTNTDWVVVKYKELGKAVPAAWKSYRQALRDIPTQEGFPNNVIFPEKPTES